MTQPLVSVIVPTKNSAEFLTACLTSIRAQTYPHIELIVVDNHSTDSTPAIAKTYADHTYTRGPERSAQRNYGVAKAKGTYVAIIDSDMELTPEVISQAVVAMNPEVAGIIIPEESFGVGFWARCKQLERSFYVGNDDIEAPRLFTKELYVRLGGYDEALVSGEDWELGHRARATGKIVHIQALIRHNEGQLRLGRTLRKKYYYAQRAKAYLAKAPTDAPLSGGTGPLARYKLFFSRPGTLFRRPLLGCGVLFMKTCEYASGGFGYVMSAAPEASATTVTVAGSDRQTKSVSAFLDEYPLSHMVMLGYYGGGNFGDELLLEVLSAELAQRNTKDVTVMYRGLASFNRYHHDYGFKKAESGSKTALISQLWRNPNIVVGGGGLWGMDVNANVLLLSAALFLAGRVLRKNVYLVGVGYYGSTNRLGHVSAWLAAKSSRLILARDAESYAAFSRLNKKTYRCDDIAYLLRLSLMAEYQKDSEVLSAQVEVRARTTFVAIRHFRKPDEQKFLRVIEQVVAARQDHRFIVCMLQPAESFIEGQVFLKDMDKKYANVQVLDTAHNPMALVSFLLEHRKKLVIVAPQFHVILVAAILGIPLLPITYDNKVRQLITNETALEPIGLADCSAEDVTTFLQQHGA